jgi:hypothetical protein
MMGELTRRILSMGVESWNAVFQWGSVGLIAVTFVFGAGALWTGNKINARQTERLVMLEKDLASAKTALAEQQERAAKAELQLAYLRNPRSLDTEKFRAALLGKPKSPVVIWYAPNDEEAYLFAWQITGALIAAGWEKTVQRPAPIPEEASPAETVPLELRRAMPPVLRAGGQPTSSVSLVSSRPGDMSALMNAASIDTPVGFLRRALDEGGVQTLAWSFDNRLAPDVVRLIVSPKP